MENASWKILEKDFDNVPKCWLSKNLCKIIINLFILLLWNESFGPVSLSLLSLSQHSNCDTFALRLLGKAESISSLAI